MQALIRDIQLARHNIEMVFYISPFAQLEQGLGHRAVIFGEDMFAGFEVV
jgi:hypothetical protein